MIKDVDINKDNQIDYNEFIEMMRKDLAVWLGKYNMSLSDLSSFRPQCTIFWDRGPIPTGKHMKYWGIIAEPLSIHKAWPLKTIFNLTVKL